MMSRCMVLAHWADVGAVAVAAAAVTAFGRDRVAFVSPTQLATARWRHLVGSGSTSTSIRLANGAIVEDGRTVVFNRVATIPSLSFGTLGSKDADYAAAEWQALYVSWLAGLGSAAINPIDSFGRPGPSTRLAWLRIANLAGVEVADVETSNRGVAATVKSVLVAGDKTVGTTNGAIADRCQAIASLAACPLIELWFSDDDEPRFVDASSHPLLHDRLQVDAAIRLIARTMRDLDGGSR